MKSDDIMLVLMIGGATILGLHHRDVYRDVYTTREDCVREWNSSECSSSSSHGGGYVGPTYERGARRAPHSSSRSRQILVKRSGFGFSGARYTAGG